MNHCSAIAIGLFCIVIIACVLVVQFVILPLLTLKIKTRLPPELSEQELVKQLSKQDSALKLRLKQFNANMRY